MTNNIAVSITADVADLQVKRAILSAELRQATTDINNFARTANKSGMTNELRANMLTAADAIAKNRAQIRAVDTEMKALAASETVTAEATTAETVATEASTIAHTRNRAVTESLVMVHEALSGRLSRMPGSLMILTQALTGGSLAMTGMVLAGVALVGGFGYLEYEALKARKELDHLTEGFRLTGQGGEYTKDVISYNIDFLSRLPGVTREAAQAYMQYAAQHAQADSALLNEVGQLMPAFVDLYGKQAPEAVGKLLESLSNLTEEGFQKLDNEMLHLSPQEYEQIDNLIRIGDTAKATQLILDELSKHAGIYIKSTGDQIYDIEQQINRIKVAMTPSEREALAKGLVGDADVQRVRELETHLQSIRRMEAEQGKESADDKYKHDYEDAQKLNIELDRRGKITTEIAKLEGDLRQAHDRGDVQGVETYTKALANERAELKKFDEEQARKNNKSGFSNAGAEEIAQAKKKVSEINATENMGAQERLAAIKAVYAQLLNSDKLNAAQRLQVQRDLNRAIAQAEREAGTEQHAIAADDARTKVELARLAYDQKKAMLDQEVADGKISKAQELQTLIAAQAEIEKLELEAVDAEEAGLQKGTAAFERAENEKKLIAARTESEIAKLYAELAQDEEREAKKGAQAWDQANRSILSSESNFISSAMSGRETFTQMAARAALDLVREEITADAKYWSERALLELEGQDLSAAREQGGILVHALAEREKTFTSVTNSAARTAAGAAEQAPFLARISSEVASWLGLETAKTTTTVAGATARGAASATETAVTVASVKAAALAEIPAYTGIAAMGAASAVAPIPIIGPALAAAAIAEIDALGASQLTLASFDVGTNYVPRDMVAQIHAGERIIPAADNRALMSAIQGSDLSTTRNRGGDTIHNHFAPNIASRGGTAMDDLREAQSEFVAWMAGLHRQGALRFDDI